MLRGGRAELDASGRGFKRGGRLCRSYSALLLPSYSHLQRPRLDLRLQYEKRTLTASLARPLPLRHVSYRRRQPGLTDPIRLLFQPQSTSHHSHLRPCLLLADMLRQFSLIAFLWLLLPLAVVAQFPFGGNGHFNPFGQQQQQHHQHQQQQDGPPASQRGWQLHKEGACRCCSPVCCRKLMGRTDSPTTVACDRYTCPSSLACVDKPLDCPCPYPCVLRAKAAAAQRRVDTHARHPILMLCPTARTANASFLSQRAHRRPNAPLSARGATKAAKR